MFNIIYPKRIKTDCSPVLYSHFNSALQPFTVEPINFLIPLEDQTVDQLPSTATFTCEISKKGLKAEWRRAGKTITTNGKYRAAVDGGKHTLTIMDVVGEDEDEYTVVFAEGTESTAKLFVKGEFFFHYI